LTRDGIEELLIECVDDLPFFVFVLVLEELVVTGGKFGAGEIDGTVAGLHDTVCAPYRDIFLFYVYQHPLSLIVVHDTVVNSRLLHVFLSVCFFLLC
jgi:hypothetical protein